MQEAFGIVIFVVVILAVIAAVWAAWGTGALYKQIGRGGLSMDRDDDMARPSSPAVSQAVANEEIRQMLTARNDRRARRGEEPLDIDAEIARLTAPSPIADPALEAEVRSLVIARNARRARRGEAPLDVDEEVRRQLSELS